MNPLTRLILFPATILQMFSHRKMLKVDVDAQVKGPRLLVMTYNLLFRANSNRNFCQHKTYYYEGRDEIIACEIDNYKPDILCLQEVSRDDDFSFWKSKLEKLGYRARFCAHESRNHGIAIAYKKDSFEELGTKLVFYHNFATEELIDHVRTCHAALFVALIFKGGLAAGGLKPHKQGIIVGTTHLSPFPRASYERTQQAGILLKSVKNFADSLSPNADPTFRFYTIIAGDFNSPPEDAAYVSLTTKPVKFDGITRVTLGDSIIRDPKDKSFSQGCFLTKDSKLCPQATSRIAKLEEFHNNIKSKAISLYAVGYHKVHEDNTGSIHKEPKYSFWGNRWQGLLDYIFAVCHWDGVSSSEIDDPIKCASESGVNVVALLEMPTLTELISNVLPQPRMGMYPSDHFCMMAEVELL